jgi:hypothetical protein
MKLTKWLLALAVLPLLLSAYTVVSTGTAMAADYSNSDLMSDQVFDNVGSMTATQIQAFLNGSDARIPGGSTCLKNYTDVNFYWDGSNWHYGDNTESANGTLVSSPWNSAWGPAQIPAYQAIYQSAQQWGFNPQVLLATLQKEESLITGTSCSNQQYWSAMGYDCPDAGGQYSYPTIGVSNTCVEEQGYVGFSRQVLWAGWQLKFDKERSLGNTSWDGDDSVTYGGYMTQGTYARCGTCSTTYYDGYATLDGVSTYMSDGATAAFYTYTPHLNQALPGIFETWFGSTMGGPAASFSSFTQSTTTPTIGEPVTVSYTLTNTLSSSITLDTALIADRFNGTNLDFAGQGTTTLTAGQAKTITGTFTPTSVGQYQVWPSYSLNDVWYSGQTVNINANLPSLSLTSGPSISPEFPLVGQQFTPSFTIKNTGNQPAYIGTLLLANRTAGLNTDYQSVTTSIQPGQSYTYTDTRTLANTTLQTGWVSYKLANGIWYDPGDQIGYRAYSSPASVTVTKSLRLSAKYPLAGKSVTATFTLHNSGDQPVRYAYLGATVRRASDNANFDFSGNPTGMTSTLVSGNSDYNYSATEAFPTKDTYNAVISSSTDGTTFSNPPAGSGVQTTLGFSTYNTAANLAVSTPLSLSATSLSQDQVVTATYALTNSGDQPIDLASIDVYCRNMAVNCDHAAAATTVSGGQTYNFSQQIWFDGSGLYTLAPMVNEAGQWVVFGNSLSEDVAMYTPGIGSSLNLSLALGGNNFAVGSQATANMGVTNKAAFTLHLAKALIAARYNGQNMDFASQNDLVINANTNAAAGGLFTFNRLGTFNFWPAVYTNGVWEDATPTQIVTHYPNLVVSSPLTVTPESGHSATMTFTVTNNEPTTVTMAIASNDRMGTTNDDYPIQPVNIASGASYTYSQGQTFAGSGAHSAWVGYMAADGTWHALSQPIAYTVP